VEDDEAGRLAGFRARYGRTFDAQKNAEDFEQEAPPAAESLGEIGSEGLTGVAQADQHTPQPTQVKKAAPKLQNEEIDDGWDFGDDDASMLDLISSYGQEDIRQKDAPPQKGKGKKK